MRLRRLNVAGFGKLRPGLGLDFAPGLNLVLAPNEGGKTTCVELITALLYGFGRRKGGVHPYEPWGAGAAEVGGELSYELAGGAAYVLSRHLLKRGERLTLRDADGRRVELGGRQPGEVHLGLSRGVFLTVSRVGLDDLQAAFSGASPKEYKAARQELLGYFFQEAATRGEVRNPVEVLAAWRAAAAGLYSRDRRQGKRDQVLNQALEQAEAELAQARQRERRAREVQAGLEALAARAADLDQRRQQAAREVDQARAALERAQVLERRAALQAEISELVARGLADEASEQRARDLEREAAAAEQRAGRLQAQAAQERARAGEGDPARQEAGLREVELDLAGLKAREREAAAKKENLDQRQERLQQQWDMEPAALAGLEEDLPFCLRELARAAAQAREEADRARAGLEALAPPPAWTLPLGLAGAAFLVGALGLGGAALAAWPWWVWLGSALALAAGLGLGALALARRRQAQAQAGQALALEEEARQAARHAAELEAQRERAAAGLSPLAVQAEPGRLVAARQEALALAEERRGWEGEAQALASQRRELERRVAELLGEVPGDGLDQALERARTALKAQARAHGEAQRLERAAAESQAQAKAKRQELQEFLAGAGLADLEALRQARARARQVEELTAKLAEVEQRLQETPAPAGTPSDPQACQRALDLAQARARALADELAGLSQEQGRLAQELDQLNQAPGAAQAQAGLDELREQRRELARRHGTLLLAGALLEQAMERFRLEAQPSLLQKASACLQRASAGAYEWLGSDIFEQDPGQDPNLTASPGPGAMERAAQALSRGTRDQLYLCLRLALAQEITAGGEPVPLILDDPLVNFDDRRLAATLEMLREVAQERQVLLLTCHQEQYELLRARGACHLLKLA